MKTCLWERFDRIVVFDTETTGIDFARDEIIELGAVSLEAGEERESMDCLIRLSPALRRNSWKRRGWKSRRRRSSSAGCWKAARPRF